MASIMAGDIRKGSTFEYNGKGVYTVLYILITICMAESSSRKEEQGAVLRERRKQPGHGPPYGYSRSLVDISRKKSCSPSHPFLSHSS